MLSRRKILHAGCTIAAVTFSHGLDVALAGINNPGNGAGSAFNFGRSQGNLNFLQTGGDYPFLNCLKTAQAWAFFDNADAPITPDTLDSDGYPTSISHTGVYTVFFVPTQAARPGNYVVTWDGTGTIIVNMNNTLVSGSKTSSGGAGAGRYVFSTTAFRFVVGIASIGSPRITNMKVFHVDDEIAINAGQIFGAKFKARLQEARFGVLRFLNWQNSNQTNVTTWATRRAASYIFYSGYELRSSLYAGVTTNVANAYTVAAPSAWGGLVDKATVHIVFNASATQSGTCSLNVGATGDINILNEQSGALTVGSNSYPIGGTFQSMATLVYDADINAWIKQGGDVAVNSAGLNNGVPPELLVRLCTEIGAHPYFVAPPFACTPMTDWHTQLATYCKNNGPSWMIPRFEGPNELWNTAAGNNQTGYANTKATAYGWGADYHNWYGRAISTIGQAVSTVYGNDRTKYQVLCGVQTSTGTSGAGTANSNPRLASTKYLLQTPQSPYTATAASGWATHVCCAQYFSPSDYGTAAETTEATAFAGGDLTQPGIYVATCNSGAGNFTLAKCATLYANWKTWAQGFSIQKMCGYEGGYSPDYTSLGNSNLDRLRAASKLELSLVAFTATNYNNFVGLTGSGFTAEFPSCFQFAGNINIVGYSQDAWSVLEDIYQTPNSPQWTAIVTFNH